MEDDIFMTIGELNSLRRDAVSRLTEAILAPHKRKHPESYVNSNHHNNLSPDILSDKKSDKNEVNISGLGNKTGDKTVMLNCHITNMEQLGPVLENKYVQNVYVEWSVFVYSDEKSIVDVNATAEKIHQAGKNFYIALPHIGRKNEIEYLSDNSDILFANCVDGYLVRNIEEYLYISKNINTITKPECNNVKKDAYGTCSERKNKEITFDYSVYTFNKMAKEALKEISINNLVDNDINAIPLELNYNELKKRGCQGEEILVYGYVPVMISAGCIKKTTGSCNKKSDDIYLIDRMKNKFLCRSECRLCYNMIYNSKPISLLEKSGQVKDLGIKAVRLSFVKESTEEVRDIIDKFSKQYIEDIPQDELSDFTRGHFTRGVD